MSEKQNFNDQNIKISLVNQKEGDPLWMQMLDAKDIELNSNSEAGDLFSTKIIDNDVEKTTCNICGKKIRLNNEKEELEHGIRDHMNEILPGLFLGGCENASNHKEILHFKIQNIINAAAHELDNPFYGKKIDYLNLKWPDGEYYVMGKELEMAMEYIHSCLAQKRNILVHCVMGISRSASVVIGYLIYHHKMTFDAAFKFVKSKRSWAYPNPIFRKQLMGLSVFYHGKTGLEEEKNDDAIN